MAKKDKPETIKVRLDRPGVIACGEYRAGVVYEVTPEEAARLVEAKGFTIIKDEEK